MPLPPPTNPVINLSSHHRNLLLLHTLSHNNIIIRSLSRRRARHGSLRASRPAGHAAALWAAKHHERTHEARAEAETRLAQEDAE